METYDAVIVLGAKVGVTRGKMGLAFFTEMRTRAAGISYQEGLTRVLVLSGGYNIGVRYDVDLSVPVFGTPNSDRKPNFSEKAYRKARCYRSEASVMAEFLRAEYGVPPESIILEEDSRTTKENALSCKGIVDRSGWKKVALLTQLYHMERALKTFWDAGVQVSPLFAEDLLPLENGCWIDKICEYYSVPKGGKQWDTEKIRELLSKGESVEPLLAIL